MQLDGKVNPKRIKPHIFVTDSKSCLNGTVQKMGYKLCQKDNRVTMQKMNGVEEIAL